MVFSEIHGDNVTNGPHMFDDVVVVPSKFKPKN
jgi:hypothetical protein